MTSEGNYNIYLFLLSHRLEVRAQVAQAFLAKFQLSQEEMTTLRGARDAPVTEVIFMRMYTDEFNHAKSSPFRTRRMGGCSMRYRLWPRSSAAVFLCLFFLLLFLHYLHPLVK